MSVTVVISAHYSELYGTDATKIPRPAAGERIRDYIARAGIGREEDILPVVGGRAKSFRCHLKDGDVLTIYPLAAGG